MQSAHGIRWSRSILVVVLVAAAIAAGVVVRPLSRPASAADASDCGFRAVDVDTLNLDGGAVDFGDTPRTGAPFGNAVVCFAPGRQTITVQGTVFWDSSRSGCATVGLNPTYYDMTDPPVESLREFHVCSKGGGASAPVSYTFTTSSLQYDGLGIHLFRNFAGTSQTNVLNTTVHYGDTAGQ
jgi:hypothetical protein